MSGITSHVLDTSLGVPAAGLTVRLARRDDAGAVTELEERRTNADGRVADLLGGRPLAAGVYRLTFETGAYFAAEGKRCFYPRVEVVFEVDATDRHYHVPLLLSPFGYSTYRGS